MLKDLIRWTLIPAMLTLALLGAIQLGTEMANFSHTVTGTAFPSGCVTIPGAMFDDCAALDSSQVEDLR